MLCLSAGIIYGNLFMGRRVPGLWLLWTTRKGGRGLLGVLSLLEVTEKASKPTMAPACWAGGRCHGAAGGGCTCYRRLSSRIESEECGLTA